VPLLRKISKTIVPFFLLVVLCSLVNATVNQHFHRLSTGIVIKHAHPFDRGQEGAPFQEHHHTSSELLILDQISNPVLLLGLFFLSMIFLLPARRIRNATYNVSFVNPDLFFLKNYHAPPLTSY
jgi:hypothetical protein